MIVIILNMTFRKLYSVDTEMAYYYAAVVRHLMLSQSVNHSKILSGSTEQSKALG